MKWINANDKRPDVGQNVIAIGTWYGEIQGMGESEYMGIGEWDGNNVNIASDSYSTQIFDITHWMPLPEWP